MDSTKLILTEPALPPAPLENLQKSGLKNLSEEKKKQIAKDFESVLLNKMLDQMKNSIGNWGFEKDGTTEQVQGIFWMFLARDMANNGGIGLWKDIYQYLTNAEKANPSGKSLDGQI
jgi:Rod binding domain-containing protein